MCKAHLSSYHLGDNSQWLLNLNNQSSWIRSITDRKIPAVINFFPENGEKKDNSKKMGIHMIQIDDQVLT